MTLLFEEIVARAESGGAENRGSPRAVCLQAAREYANRRRRLIRERHEAGESGHNVVRSLAETADFLVKGAFRLSLAWHTSDPAVASRVCLCALGGYGRSELSPYSDLDVCLIHEGPIDEPLEQLNHFLVHFLWDMGFTIGHAVRSIQEAQHLAREDLKAFTSLLESRLICGSSDLFAELKLCIKELQRGESAARFVQHRLKERFEGLPPQYSNLFAPEPNVKENAGGLRDFHTALWLLMMVSGAESLDDAAVQGHVAPEEQLEFAQALDFIWRVRNEMHFRLGKAEDRLSYANQRLVAKAFGYDSAEQSSALLLMQDYYAAAVQMRRFLTIAAKTCNRSVAWDSVAAPDHARRDIFGEDGVLFAGMTDPNWFAHAPARLMEVYWECARRNAQLSRTTERLVTDHLHLVGDTFRSDELVRRYFLAICNRPLQAGQALRQAANSGLLGRYIPEFEAVKGVLRHQDFHHYPVDEHTLQAIEALGVIPQMNGTVGRCLQEALEHLSDPYILVMAVLFHDLGKVLGEEHLSESVRRAEQICARIGMSDEDRDRIRFLVRRHMLMNTLSQWRDTDDEHIIQSFVQTVQTEDRLRALFLFSFADLYAVGPDVWTDWKGTLLLQLYLRAIKRLLGRAETLDEEFWRSDRAEEVRRVLPAELRGEVEPHLRGLGQRYFLAFPPDQIAEHIRCIEEARRNGLAVHSHEDRANGRSVVVVCTRDRQGLFSMLAGAFSSQLLDVNSAAVFTRPDGLIVDCFTVADARQERPLTKAQVKTVERVLRQTLLYGEDIREHVQRAKSRLFALFQPRVQTPTRIAFDNDSSRVDTVIDVETGDRTGLLYDIARAIADAGLNITTARIVTDARRVRDSFYVNRNGRKIETQEEQEAVRGEIHAAIHPRSSVETKGETP